MHTPPRLAAEAAATLSEAGLRRLIGPRPLGTLWVSAFALRCRAFRHLATRVRMKK